MQYSLFSYTDTLLDKATLFWGDIILYEYDKKFPVVPAIGFAGGLEDPETGLVRFCYRDYDPEVGRKEIK